MLISEVSLASRQTIQQEEADKGLRQEAVDRTGLMTRTVAEIEVDIAKIELERSSDYCMCGSLVENHTWHDGHSPVSELDFATRELRKELYEAQNLATAQASTPQA